jgi:putative ABC transport system permease protein
MDSLQEILFTLRQNKLRTGLTAFGVFWGILMLILLLGAGRGMEKAFLEGNFNDTEDSMWIIPDITSIPYQGFSVGRQVRFTEEDALAIRQEIPGVRFLSSENPLGNFINSDILVNYGTRSGVFQVLGVADEYFNIKEKVEFKNGRRLNYLDKEDSRKVAVIGTRVKERLFAADVDPIGKDIQVNGIIFRVVGIFYDKGNQGRMSERVYMPVSAFKKTFGGGTYIDLITVRPKEGVDGVALEGKILNLLKERHHIAPSDNRAIFVINYASITRDIKETFSGLNLFIWLVGIGTLLAGIVGVSNIMIITVRERTREIGIRKALGAKPTNIVCSLLFESILVTSVAGYAGLVMGVVLLESVANILEKLNIQLPYFQKPEIDLHVAISALVVLVIAGALAGLMPALRAARIMPIEAMRAE